jgi:hypothetical protein
MRPAIPALRFALELAALTVVAVANAGLLRLLHLTETVQR